MTDGTVMRMGRDDAIVVLGAIGQSNVESFLQRSMRQLEVLADVVKKGIYRWRLAGCRQEADWFSLVSFGLIDEIQLH